MLIQQPELACRGEFGMPVGFEVLTYVISNLFLTMELTYHSMYENLLGSFY